MYCRRNGAGSLKVCAVFIIQGRETDPSGNDYKIVLESDVMVKFIRKVSDFEQKKKQIDSNIESAQNVILSNCTKPRTGQLKNIGIWG